MIDSSKLITIVILESMEANVTPSSKEKEALIEFRKNLKDVLEPKHDDNFLLRWLRARDFKLKDAEAMLRKSLDWRKNGKIDFIQENYHPPEVVQKYWPLGFCGYDKEGCPVLFLKFGDADIRGLLYSTKASDIIDCTVKLLEISETKMKEQTHKLGKLVDQLVIFCDLNNFAFYQIAWGPAFQFLSSLIKIYEDNYPERMKHALCINTPAIFHVAFALLKPFFSEKTYQKVNLMKREVWKPVLLKEIDEDQLPAYLGGKMVGPNNDIYCTHLVPMGGKIPTSFYAREKSLYHEKEAETILIKAASSCTIDILVSEPESVLHWEFRTDSRSIGFGIFWRNGTDVKELVPIEKMNCDIFPETGSWYCKKKGIYQLKFDNSFSWTRSKTVRYFTSVTPAKTE